MKSLLWVKLDRLAIDTMSLILGVAKSLQGTYSKLVKAHLQAAIWPMQLCGICNLLKSTMCRHIAPSMTSCWLVQL